MSVANAQSAAALLQLAGQRHKAGDRVNEKALNLSAIACDVDCADAYHNLSAIAVGAGRYDASIALAKRGLALKPDNGPLWLNLAVSLWRAQRFIECGDALDRAGQHGTEPSSLDHVRGLLHYAVGPIGEAVSCMERAIKARGGVWLECSNDLAHAVLKSGDLARGLELLEGRWNGMLAKSVVWDCGLQKWEGERIDGARGGLLAQRRRLDPTLLLHAEQGIGDTLQFIRFVPQIKQASGASHIIFAAPKLLCRLLQGQCGIDEVIDIDSPGAIVKAARVADYHCPLISAVCALKPSYETLPEAKPYLCAPFETSSSFHDGGAKLAVGLVWAASPGRERSRQRSVQVEELLDLGTIPGARLWSLQFAPHAKEIVDCGGDCLVADATAGLSDCADTAAVVKKLDLVVTVDTAMVHLCGALGVPCFMLNPINPCWRWCNGAAPWYSSVELFDQMEATNWKAPIAQIKARIAEMVDGYRSEGAGAGRAAVRQAEVPGARDDNASQALAPAEARGQGAPVQGGRISPRAKLALPDVTLVFIDTIAHKLTAAAARECMSKADFREVIIFSDERFVPEAGWVPIAKCESLEDAMKVLWYTVPHHLKTSHALIAQYDSWIINPDAWDDAWLQYDYIGAPWGWHGDGLEVGNGGFSLRSRTLMDFLAEDNANYLFAMPEDDAICRVYGSLLREAGFRFAPMEVAEQFSIERSVIDNPALKTRAISDTNKPFGFHGMFNWDAVLSDADIAGRIADAPDYVLDHPHYDQLLRRLYAAGRAGRTVPRHHAASTRILVKRSGAFGDVLAITPVVHRLRQQLRSTDVICVETQYPQIFAGNPDVTSAAANCQDANYGWHRVIDLNGSYERRLRKVHAIDCYMLDAFGNTEGDKSIRFAAGALPDIGLADWGHVVALHPAASWRNRTLPRAFWQSVADWLTGLGYAVVALGTGRDHGLDRVIDTRGKYSPAEQAAIIGASCCYIGSDCGLMVLAASTDTPIVGLFTISPPQMNIFWRHGEPNWNCRIMMPDLPCIGCSARLTKQVTHHDCERGDFACVDAFKVSDVVDAVMSFVGARTLQAAE
jgi:ADP-heptose:LPS heptosyltransferase